MKLGKNGEVQHVLIKTGEKLVLPKPSSKIYPGNFKEKLQEVFGKDSTTELKGAEVKTKMVES